MQENIENNGTENNETENSNIENNETDKNQNKTIKSDEKSCLITDKLKRYYTRLVSQVYATNNSEFNLFSQFLFQSIIFENNKKYEISKLLNTFVLEEVDNIKKLANLLLDFNVKPVFTFIPPYSNIFYSTRFVNYLTNNDNMIDVLVKYLNNITTKYNQIIKLVRENNVVKVLNELNLTHKKQLKMLQDVNNML